MSGSSDDLKSLFEEANRTQKRGEKAHRETEEAVRVKQEQLLREVILGAANARAMILSEDEIEAMIQEILG